MGTSSVAEDTVRLVEIPVPQLTIKSTRSIAGPAAFVDGNGQLTFLPAEPDTGIVFEVAGHRDPTPVSVRNLVHLDKGVHTTTLSVSDSMHIPTVEHVLSAVRGLGISNLRILTGPNGLVPLADGSAFDFVDLLVKAEVVAQAGTHQTRIDVVRPFEVRSDDSFALVEPDPGLVIEAVITFGNPIGLQQDRYQVRLS